MIILLIYAAIKIKLLEGSPFSGYNLCMRILLVSIDLVLGTRILINVLKRKGHKVKNLELKEVRYSEPVSKKALADIYRYARNFDVIGLAFNSFYAPLARELAGYLKSKGIKIIIAGGPHATALPEEVAEYVDAVVVYEAEITLPKLIERIKKGSFPGDIKGLVLKRGKRIINTGCPLIENNPDNIPFQSFSPRDILYYNVRKRSFEKPTLDTIFPYRERNYFILTSRGCPFKCSYCCNSLFARLNSDFARMRKRSIENIISEMKIAKKSGFNGFYIADDNFLAFSLKEIEDFSKSYKKEIRLPFGLSGLNPNNMRIPSSAKKIDLLLDSGLSDMRIGVQSGSNKTLKKFNRKYRREELTGLLAAFVNRKTIWKKPNDTLRVAVDFICDAPWENEKDKIDTIDLANSLLPAYGIFFYSLVYLPGTDIYDLALKKEWIKDKKRDIYLKGIAGVDDNIYNRLLFLIAVLRERGSGIPPEIISFILKNHKRNPELSEKIIDFVIKAVNDTEAHHGFNIHHLTLHPYLKGFNKWRKTVGQKGRKVLFRSYHEPYG